ncbi:3-hydroxybenzoate 6-monooxygenase [Roseomonas sp. CCTCC AB2023176]|uniref:3-hydroxybenzoate 6-monooxygenase n=1 Tax=Roseomonas sp. CCTCC AB2023176 TaxID=3342640 RepID=UPI0035E255E4
MDERIIVAGGGIGGLAAALAISRAGFPVLVLEKAAELGEIGAGIQLGPNAFRAFEALGVSAGARKTAVYVDRLVMMDAATAEEVCHVDVGEAFRARFGNPYAVVHRGELHRVLLRACEADPRITLRTNAAIAGYETAGGGATAVLASGERLEAAALIGADGLWSMVRAQLVGDGKPRVSGHTTYRSVIPTEQMPADIRWNAAALWCGPKVHLVHYPLSDGKTFNLVVTAHNDATQPAAGVPVPHGEVLRLFAHVHPRAQQLIHAGRDWKYWVLCDREPVTRWTDGPVALLGDAAHPTLQYLAQGACMAMEDAVTLGECLSDHPRDIPAALVAYQDARVLRTARVVLQSRAIGEHVYHPVGAHAALRNQIMGAKSQAEWLDVFDWLYGSGWQPRAQERRAA